MFLECKLYVQVEWLATNKEFLINEVHLSGNSILIPAACAGVLPSKAK